MKGFPINHINRLTFSSVLLIATLMVVSCRSSKNVTATDDGGGPGLTVVENFTSRVRVKLTQGSKDMATSGTLRMRRGDVIQLSLTDPILGIAEVGRLEISPDSALIIDRLNRRYVSENYATLSELTHTNLTYRAIEDRFWDEAKGSDKFSFVIPLREPVTLDIELFNKGNGSDWEPRTSVSKSYKKTSIQQVIGSLTK